MLLSMLSAWPVHMCTGTVLWCAHSCGSKCAAYAVYYHQLWVDLETQQCSATATHTFTSTWSAGHAHNTRMGTFLPPKQGQIETVTHCCRHHWQLVAHTAIPMLGQLQLSRRLQQCLYSCNNMLIPISSTVHDQVHGRDCAQQIIDSDLRADHESDPYIDVAPMVALGATAAREQPSAFTHRLSFTVVLSTPKTITTVCLCWDKLQICLVHGLL
jgi:hypothetical protein